jgi:hypothetical protein
MTLAMCEIKCSVYFCLKRIGVSWLCTYKNSGSEYTFSFEFQSRAVSLICRLPILFLQITYVLDDIFASYVHLSCISLHTCCIEFLWAWEEPVSIKVTMLHVSKSGKG